ncbi:MAG: putative potassium channel NAD-binding component TrkA [Nitrospira sp.]|jgi:voltage-gated potassium channel|nr:putative potassium channel NAD-binding component TrkA [Nitrospira sp.]
MVIERLPRRLAHQVFFTPSDLLLGRKLFFRVLLMLVLVAAVFVVLWLDRDGLQDHSDGEISLVDALYFAMVTITTVGYGDIVPVTPRARLIDAVVVTPMRVVIWLLFLGTAYQLVVRQYMEGYRMAKIQATLRDHIIVCGFGYTGWSSAKELLAKGADSGAIVVIDPSEDRVQAALELGMPAFRGDATQESILQNAMIQKAQALIIATGRDDTSALILLTARHLNPTLEIVVSAQEEENVKLFRQGGATAIISPSTFGGYLLAAAIGHPHFVGYVQDLLTAGGRVNLIERTVEPQEVGQTAMSLKPNLLLRVYRKNEILGFWDFEDGRTFEHGDTLLIMRSRP